MKKSIFLMAGLIGLALTSCEDTSDLGVMQKNEAPIVVPADGVALRSLYSAEGNKINLQTFEESVNIPLIDIELASSFPAEAVVTGQVEIADNPDFDGAYKAELSSMTAASANPELAAMVSGDTRSYKGFITVSDWEEAFVSFYGLNPAPNVNYLRYRLWLSTENENLILYDKDGDEWYDAMTFTVTPLNANLDVAPAYTLFYTIEGKQYTMDMYHNDANHQYDDPIFNAMVEVTTQADGETANVLEWWVAPSDNLDRTFGVNADDPAEASGTLAELSEGAIKGQIDIPGTYKIEVDMLAKTFTVQIAPSSLYVIYTGGQFSTCGQLSTEDYVTYSGMAGLTNVWALAGQANYKPTLYVNDPSVEVTENAGTLTGGLAYTNAGVTEANTNGIPYSQGAGLYYITANLQTLKYTSYRVREVGVTGSMEEQNWGAGADIALKGSRTTIFMQWTGTLNLKAGDQWKIRCNSDWAVNFGATTSDGAFATDGSDVELVMNGDNFVAPEDGTYDVTVFFNRQFVNGKMTPYRMTVTKK